MALGNAFPPALALESVKRQLLPGTVIKLHVTMDDGKLHEKRFVILHVENGVLTCVINTDIPKLVQNNPDLLKCQVRIDQRDHKFMKWESHIDCSRIRLYPESDVCTQLVANPDWIFGTIMSNLRNDICGALKFSPLESSALVGACCASLQSVSLKSE